MKIGNVVKLWNGIPVHLFILNQIRSSPILLKRLITLLWSKAEGLPHSLNWAGHGTKRGNRAQSDWQV